MSDTGIYVIENLVNGRKYVGASKNIKSRWRQHKLDLKKNEHANALIQEDFLIYGMDVFNFFIIEICEESSLIEKEEFYIKEYKTRDYDGGYNMTSGIGTKNKVVKEETRKKISSKLLGNKNGINSWQTRIKNGISFSGENSPNYGRKASEETRAKISAGGTGRIQKDSTRKKIGDGLRFKKKKNSSSEYIGVLWHVKAKKWQASFYFYGKHVYGGLFEEEIDAAMMYNELAILYFGDMAVLNNL